MQNSKINKYINKNHLMREKVTFFFQLTSFFFYVLATSIYYMNIYINTLKKSTYLVSQHLRKRKGNVNTFLKKSKIMEQGVPYY